MQILTVHNKLYMFMIPIARNSSRFGLFILVWRKRRPKTGWAVCVHSRQVSPGFCWAAPSESVGRYWLTGAESEKKPAIWSEQPEYIYLAILKLGPESFHQVFHFPVKRATRLGPGTSNSSLQSVYHVAYGRPRPVPTSEARKPDLPVSPRPNKAVGWSKRAFDLSPSTAYKYVLSPTSLAQTSQLYNSAFLCQTTEMCIYSNKVVTLPFILAKFYSICSVCTLSQLQTQL